MKQNTRRPTEDETRKQKIKLTAKLDIRIDEDDERFIVAECKKHKCSRGEVMRRLIRERRG